MLYNQFRPHTFDGIVGQRNIVENIRNQSLANKFFGTYIFAGQYGSGKTTMARVLAMAANCTNKDSSGNPCCECAACKSILDKSAVDVVEVDGASNNGVDKVRELIGDTTFKAVMLKKKVYIIDEVHMLSTGAFNALLKTLEEPNENTIFILATTELRKIPDTVISRSACYVFGRIEPEEIAKRVMEVAAASNIAVEPAAAELIARRSDGSMRNALSLLEQAGVGGSVTVTSVRSLIGLRSDEEMAAFLNSVIKGEVGEITKKFSELTNGADALSVVTDLIGLVTDSIVSGTGGKLSSVLSHPLDTLVEVGDLLLRVREQFRQGLGKNTALIEFIKYNSVRSEIRELSLKVEELSKKLLRVKKDVPDSEGEDDKNPFLTDDETAPIESGKVATTATTLPKEEAMEECAPLPPEVEAVTVSEPLDESLDEPESFFDDFGFDAFSGFGFSEQEKSVTADSTEEKPTVAQPVTEQAEDTTKIMAALDAAAERDPMLKEILNTGCTKRFENGKVILATAHMPLSSILKDCIEAYALLGVEAVYDPEA